MPTIEVRGLNELKAILGKIEPAINAVIYSVATEIMGKMKIYPTQIPGTRYRRTDKLKHNWNIKKGSFTATIGNNTEYGPWVQDREKQATIHQFSGWKTTQDISEEYDPIVQTRLEEGVLKVLR